MVKYLFAIFIVLFSFNGFSQSSETYQGEAVNRRDAENNKQGVWVTLSKSGKLEEKGEYTNNKKEGLWYGYYPSGKIKHEITYKANRPDGPAKFYYEDGKISEQGLWKINKWVGDYKYYHENGSLAYDWKYNESGKRTGEQKYYYSDGSLMIKGDWDDGKKKGILTEYHPDGSIRSEINFIEGKIDVPSIKEYEIAEKPSKKQIAPKIQSVSEPETSSGGKIGTFTQTGYYVTYNEFKKVDREGEFVKGKFVSGKRYLYNDEGELVRTLIYKDGRVSETIENE
jgi:antitoxin component YwqK of YwqJK toxin-antitoxin module